MGRMLTFRPGQEDVPVSANFTAGEWHTCRDTEPWQFDSTLVDIAQAARDILGRRVRISSGYRSAACQQAVNPGGPRNSYHVRGTAMDLVVDGMTSWQLAGLIEAIDQATGWVTGLGIAESGSLPAESVHVSVSGSEGTYRYPPVAECQQRCIQRGRPLHCHDKCTSPLGTAGRTRLDNEAARWASAVAAWMAHGPVTAPSMPVPQTGVAPWSPPNPGSPPRSTDPASAPSAPMGILPAVGIVAATVGVLVILA